MQIRMLRFITFIFILILLPFGSSLYAGTAEKRSGSRSGQKQTPGVFAPVTRKSIKNDRTIELRKMQPLPHRVKKEGEGRSIPNRVLPKAAAGRSTATRKPDSALQNVHVLNNLPETFQNFEGSPNNCNCVPPDTNGDVGPDHYVQTVNADYQVFDKNGTSLLGPLNINTLWTGFGGACENTNNGDPIVLYDHLSDRWLISQFALPNFPDGPFSQCVAVSTSGDPAGSYFRYQFVVPSNKLNDYPHIGVWMDGYYMTVNQFNAGTLTFGGAGVFAFERDKMLNGNPAQMVYFDLFSVDPNFGGMLPSDLDGPAPPAGTPNVFAEADDESVFGTDRLSLWDFHVDWDTPENSTFGIDGNPSAHLDTAAFDWDLCGFSRDCISQPGTGQGLDAISDRLMHRLQYRYFGGFSTLVVNHTVDADGTDHAGVRWYELRDDGFGWAIHQQGTFAPDGENRWMGSIAMDSFGNIALGYSVSSSTVFPSIRYAARLASDPPGEMTQGEGLIIEGTGSQSHPEGRWGDYSGMTVDPSPGSAGGIDCDFWYTTEYIENSGLINWQTRVGAFTFAPDACGAPSGTIQGTVTDSGTSQPIAGAQLTVQPGGFSTVTDENGHYQFVLVVGNYDVTVTSFGFVSQTANSVAVSDGGTTIQDFKLILAPVVSVSGTVTDGSGHGWPLYARIDIEGFPSGPVFTNPETGAYTVTLVQDEEFAFNVTALAGGYTVASRDVTPPSGGSTEDFGLQVDALACTAPGYAVTTGLAEDFNSGSLPDGWTVITNGPDTNVSWTFDDPCGKGNNTGGTGAFAIVDSDCTGFNTGFEDTELRTPVLDFSGKSSIFIEFDTEFLFYPPSLHEKGDVDVSIDGGSTWTNVLRYQNADVTGPHHETIDISSIAANQANVLVRFRYHEAEFEFYWQVDNVRIGQECNPIPGGLLIGNTFDLNTSIAINDVTITSDGAPEDTTISFATPEDNAVDDGFYILFSSLTGPQPITASKFTFGNSTQNPVVVADSIVRQDFFLGSGSLQLAPDPLEVTVDLGSQSTVQLNISNTGTAAADFELKEAEAATVSLTKVSSATPVIRRSGKFTPLRYGYKPKQPIGGKLAKTNPDSSNELLQKPVPGINDAPWTAIADFPIAIMDSTAVEIDGLIYSVGGFDGQTAINTLQIYDPGSDSWSEGAPMSVEREKPEVVAIDSLIYVVGGWDQSGNPNPTLEIYDPASNTWSEGAPVPTAYAAAAGVNLDGRFYVIGGCDSSNCGSTDVFVYEPSTDSWTDAASYPEQTSWQACGPIGGKIYCAGGFSTASLASTNTFVYDPATDAWSPLAELPQTQWGAGYIVSDDLLYVSGGVTDNTDTITNEGFAYDPSTDAWTPIANSNNVVFRGAAACGFYRIGGDIGGFSPVPNSEVLPGLTNCGNVVDVPWLSENPLEGNLPAGANTNVDVTFDASAVDQPGDFTAQLTVKENTPFDPPAVQVIMHVPVPPTWGTVSGTVTGLERCDAGSAPLKDATVLVETASTNFELKTDGNGHYQVSFPAVDAPATITVSADGYLLQSISGVAVAAQQISANDFELRLDAPCADRTPTSFDVTLASGASVTQQLTLSNAGAGVLHYNIQETDFELEPLIVHKFPARRQATGAKTGIGSLSITSQKTLAGRQSGVLAPVNSWFFGLPVPGGVVRYAHAQCDTQPNSFYVISGLDGSFVPSDKAWRYDAASNKWTELAPIPTGTEGPAAACYQGKIYVMGGSPDSANGTSLFYIYDIARNTWTSGPDLPRTVWGAAAGAWNGRVFLAGGDVDFFGSGTSAEVDVYDIADNAWIGTATDMPFAAAIPGFVQTGPFLYLVGGLNDATFPINVSATQRYDMETDTWTTGPDFVSARADLALTATDTALYALGGDRNGGGSLNPSATVERFDFTAWPDGAWEDFGDPLPVEVVANSAGFCTEAIHFGESVSEIWSTGGLEGSFILTGDSAFHGTTEHCFSVFSNVSWLSVTPAADSVAPDSNGIVDVTFNATGLTPGDYTAVLVVVSNDPDAPRFNIPVTLHVSPCLFCDEFSDDVVAGDWIYLQTWTEAGDVLTASPSRKATAFATPAFTGCLNCSLETSVSTSGGDTSRLWFFGWFQDLNNNIELVLQESNDRIILKQRSGGRIVKKQSAPFTIIPNTTYPVTMTYDGTNIVVNIDGADVITFAPSGALTAGTTGFGVKSSTGSFGFIHVN